MSHNNKKTKIKKEIKACNIHQWWTISISPLHQKLHWHSIFIQIFLFIMTLPQVTLDLQFSIFQPQEDMKTKSYERTRSFSSRFSSGGPDLFSEECFERHAPWQRRRQQKSLTDGRNGHSQEKKPARKRELLKTWKTHAHTQQLGGNQGKWQEGSLACIFAKEKGLKCNWRVSWKRHLMSWLETRL